MQAFSNASAVQTSEIIISCSDIVIEGDNEAQPFAMNSTVQSSKDQLIYKVFFDDELICESSFNQSEGAHIVIDKLLIMEQKPVRLMVYQNLYSTPTTLSQALIGTVSFKTNILLQQLGIIVQKNAGINQLTQEKPSTFLNSWVTLFDQPNDDEFDGILGEDDEEAPKIFINIAAHARNLQTLDSHITEVSATIEETENEAMGSLKTLKLNSSIQDIHKAESETMMIQQIKREVIASRTVFVNETNEAISPVRTLKTPDTQNSLLGEKEQSIQPYNSKSKKTDQALRNSVATTLTALCPAPGRDLTNQLNPTNIVESPSDFTTPDDKLFQTQAPVSRRSSKALKSSALKQKKNMSPEPRGSSATQVHQRKTALIGESKILRSRPHTKSISSISDFNKLATIFGGEVQPKTAQQVKSPTNQNNQIDEAERVRQSKQNAMAWIRDECRKYDQNELEHQMMDIKMQEALNAAKTHQSELIKSEQSKIRRVVKVDMLQHELQNNVKQAQNTRDNTEQIKDQFAASVQLFDQDRQEFYQTLNTEIDEKKSDLDVYESQAQLLKTQISETKAKLKQNLTHFEHSDQEQKLLKKISVCKNQDITQLTNELTELKDLQQTTLNTFEANAKQYQTQIADFTTVQMLQPLKQRKDAQDEHFKLQNQREEQILQNLALRKLAYSLTAQLKAMQKQIELADKRVKLLEKKKTLLVKDTEISLKTYTGQLENLNKQVLEKKSALALMQTEHEKTQNAYEQVKDLNDEQKSQSWEIQIEKLESELRQCEQNRNSAQLKLANAKLDLYSNQKNLRESTLGNDPLGNHSNETAEFFAQLRNMNKEFQGKQAEKLLLIEQLSNLRQQNQQNSNIKDQESKIAQSTSQLAHLETLIQNQSQKLTFLLSEAETLTNKKESVLTEQVKSLTNLKATCEMQSNNLALVQRRINNLVYHTKRYDSDLALLTNEREQLAEQVHQLQSLLSKRDQDLIESEKQMNGQQRKINWLIERAHQLNQTQATVPLPHCTFKPSAGNSLDNLLGDAINQYGCPVPIKKLENGYYLFGTKKIFAKVQNGRLIIRVGGGYVVIEDFIQKYAEKELAAMDRERQKNEKNSATAAAQPPTPSGHQKRTSQQFGSPVRRGSHDLTDSQKQASRIGQGIIATGDKNMPPPTDMVYSGATDSRMNGSTRQYNFHEAKLAKLKANGAVRQIN